MDSERWLPVAENPRYDVSDLGRVRRGKRILTPCDHGRGYRAVTLCGPNGARRNRFVHRLVAAAFLGPPPVGAEVNHRDFDRANNALGNLEYLTPAGNMGHAKAGGRMKRGESHGLAKLNTEDVRRIRSLLGSDRTMQAIAVEMGISISQVHAISCGRSWGWLDQGRTSNPEKEAV